MNTSSPQIKTLKSKLSKVSDDFDRLFILCELGEEYQKMWKMEKALETTSEAMDTCKNLLLKYHKIEQQNNQNSTKIISLIPRLVST